MKKFTVSASLLMWSVLLAMVLGIPSAVPVLAAQHFLPFRLYYSALLAFIGHIDPLLPLTLVFVFSVAIQRRAGVPRAGRIALLLLAAGFMIAYTWFVYRLPVRSCASGMSAFLKESMPSLVARMVKMIMTPAGVSIVIAVVALIVVGILSRTARTAKGRLRLPILAAVKPAMGRVLTFCLVICTLAFVSLHVTAGVFWLRNARTLQSKPNVIFIMVDTLRADHLGCYGYDLPTTPNIDRFARESTRFEHAGSQANWTVWSVASLQASRLPDTIFPMAEPERSVYEYFSDYYPTLTEALKEQGYVTHAVISNPLLIKGSGFEQGYDHYNDDPAAIKKENGYPTSPSVTNFAISELAKLKHRKFFLYLLYVDPHQPYYQRKGFTLPESKLDRIAQQQFGDRLGPQLMQHRYALHQRYNSEIAYTDSYVGQVLDELKRQGLYDNTLIVFFSDHGEQLGEHGNFGHRFSLYTEETRVPLLVKLPRQRQGTVVTGTFPLIDLYPSLMSYLHADTSPLGLQGDAVNLTGLLRCADKPIYSVTPIQQSVANRRYQYLQGGRQQAGPELFDLTSDPWEQHNSINQHRKVATGLSVLLDRRNERILGMDIDNFHAISHLKKQAAFVTGTEQQATIQRLRALGYLQD